MGENNLRRKRTTKVKNKKLKRKKKKEKKRGSWRLRLPKTVFLFFTDVRTRRRSLLERISTILVFMRYEMI
tara:strand:- start:80 stop:292 length:213 start_codon:yes stop_codon:yes gene_type:complete